MFGELSMLIFETQDANKYLSFDFVIFSKCFNGNLEVEIYLIGGSFLNCMHVLY